MTDVLQTLAPAGDPPLAIGGRIFRSRLMVGTGKYRSNGEMVRAISASGAEIVEEPTMQPYGVRDCAVRDPAGNLLRVQEQR